MIDYCLFSDKGSRDYNEDYVGVSQKGDSYCFILADGLGGHDDGKLASYTAVNTVKKIFLNTDLTDDFLSMCFENVQKELLAIQKDTNNENGVKTTLVILIISNGKIRWGHIGDSRLYMFKSGKLFTRTLDHSVPQMLVAMGEIKEKNIRHHIDRNRLLRVLGSEWSSSSKYEISEIYDYDDNCEFLLCTDGFWEYINEKNMQKLLKKSDNAVSWMNGMTSSVKKNGKNKNMDNYSAITIKNIQENTNVN